MSTELIINASLPETRIALMENGEIQELLIERASGKGIVGNIYKGRVTRVLPGMQAAFVDIGLEKAAFLYVDDVYVHSEIWEEDEVEAPREPQGRQDRGSQNGGRSPEESTGVETASFEGSASHGEGGAEMATSGAAAEATGDALDEPRHASEEDEPEEADEEEDFEEDSDESHSGEEAGFESESDHGHDHDDEDEDDDGEGDPIRMGPPPGGEEDESGGGSEQPAGTVAPSSSEGSHSGGEGEAQAGGEGGEDRGGDRKKRYRRGRRGGRNRRRSRDRDGREGREGGEQGSRSGVTASGQGEGTSENADIVYSEGEDRSQQAHESLRPSLDGETSSGPQMTDRGSQVERSSERGREGGEDRSANSGRSRPEFKEQRGRDRRIRAKATMKAPRGQVNIQDLLQEGQEVLVQVAKDPISTKGARLTCHISLPGRHLVCMPTIDHVGVSRRIERDDERRRLREFVERNRPRNLGFIVRTASGKQSEKRVKQDIEYLTRLWSEIREKAATVTAPALVYEDLNSVLRAIRDWVTEEIDKIIVDSRYHYNDIQRFVSHFMPALRQKVELYHGDIPIFDAYSISTELSRSLERKVWLKSGGYIVIDQAEALVAIDVNTGRYVGKKNLEDTILKTNLEAVHEIAYQLRLRNCGGIIILDFIDMEKEENKQRVYRALEEALKKDRARPSILKISELGLVEMTRKRTRDTIIRTLCESCSHCEGKGFIKSKQTVAYEVMREIEREGIDRDVTKVLVQANPDVIDILAIEERETLEQLERRYRKTIYLQAIGDFHPEQFEVTSEEKEKRKVAAQSASSERDRDRGGDRDRGRGGRDRGRGGRDRDRGGDRDRDASSSGERGQGGNGNNRPSGPPRIKPVERKPVEVSEAQASSSGGAESAEASEFQSGGSHDQSSEHSQGGSYEGGDQAPYESNGSGHEPAPTRAPGEEGYDEEDRLAFLRAQAAQDAALAGQGANGNAGGQSRQGKPGARAASGGGQNRGSWGGGSGGPGGGRSSGRRRRGRGGKPGGSRFGGRGGSGGGGEGGAGGSSEGGGEGAGGGGGERSDSGGGDVTHSES